VYVHNQTKAKVKDETFLEAPAAAGGGLEAPQDQIQHTARLESREENTGSERKKEGNTLKIKYYNFI